MTDKIKKGNVKVAFFPTQEMLADFYKTTPGAAVHTNVRKDLESARQRTCQGVCWRIGKVMWGPESILKIQMKKEY